MTTKEFIQYISTADDIAIVSKAVPFIERERFNVKNVNDQFKFEIIADYFDKYSYEELKERLEK